jgi:dienelactone hydrolase
VPSPCSRSSIALHFEPANGLLDEPGRVILGGANPFELVRLAAETTDATGRVWSSAASYRATSSGSVDTATAPALRGTYQGLDPMGLIWSMRPQGRAARSRPAEDVEWRLFCTRERASDAGTQTVARRTAVGAGVGRVAVMEGGVDGELFLPRAPKPVPGVVVLGGFDGGLETSTAGLLASHGCASLAISYLGRADRARYERVPVERLERAVEWLAARNEVDGGCLGVVGCSCGGDAALIVAALSRRPLFVVAYVPSGFVHQALHPGARASCWTYRGRELPYAPLESSGPPWETLYRSAEGWLSSADAREVPWEIPVERIRGPLVVVCAGNDGIWPSERLGTRVCLRASANGAAAPPRLVHCPGAGHHLAPPPNRPSALRHYRRGAAVWDLGGTPRDTAAARVAAWGATAALARDLASKTRTSEG